MERTCREWIWEFVLAHCSNYALIKALLASFRMPDSSVRLKRMVLLKSISLDVSEDCISESTAEAISVLRELNRLDGRADDFQVSSDRGHRISLKDLYVAVKVECTVQHLRRQEADDWPKFFEVLKNHWGDDILHAEDDANLPNLQLRKELCDVQKQPELRHAFLHKYKRSFVQKMLKSFIADAWRDLGPSFLEGVVDDLSKGFYVPTTKKSRGSFDQMRGASLASENPVEQNQEQEQEQEQQQQQQRSTLGSPQMNVRLHDSDTKFEETRLTKVRESMQTGRRKDPPTINTEAQPLVERPPQAGELIGNGYKLRARGIAAGTALDEGLQSSSRSVFWATSEVHKEEVSKVNENCSNSHARNIETRAEEDDESNNPSPPPWIGSMSQISRASPSKRWKRGFLLLDDNDCPKLVPRSCPLQSSAALEAPPGLKVGQACLNKVVKDPPLEAVAEEAAEVRESVINHVEEMVPANDLNQGRFYNPMARILPSHIGASGIGQVDHVQTTRSLTDWNPATQTFEWEMNDQIADSPDFRPPSSPRKISLPRLGTRWYFSPTADRVVHTGSHRRKHNRWNQAEENILRKEVARYGKGRWKYILQKHRKVFENRTEVDLKDKWRNIERLEGIL